MDLHIYISSRLSLSKARYSLTSESFNDYEFLIYYLIQFIFYEIYFFKKITNLLLYYTKNAIFLQVKEANSFENLASFVMINSLS